MNPLLSLNDHLNLAIWYRAAFATGGLVVALLTWILVVQIGRLIRQHQFRLITKRWKAVFEGRVRLQSVPPVHLTIGHHNRVLILSLWNNCYEEARSVESTTHIVEIGKCISLPHHAKSLLYSRRLGRKILAVRTLSRLKERTAWNDLCALITHPNPFVALHAAHALLSIDAKVAVPRLIPLIGRRTDWSPLAVATILRSAGKELASEALVRAATTGDQAVGARLIRHLPITESPSGLPILRHFLDASPQILDDFLAACLFAFGEFQDPTDLPIVRQSLFHPTWYVRVQAATALGKLGTSSDEARLTALLNDPEWWVRYRAGEALINLRSITEEKLQMLQATLPLPEAQEILATALARFRQRRRAPSLAETTSGA